MVLLFIIVDLFTTIIPALISESLLTYKYGEEFIVEALWCLFIIFILFISDNLYVFTENKMKFGDAVKLGTPMMFLSVIYLIGSISTMGYFNIWKIINLVLFCTAVGLAEEFLCRGWIQNEFIEKFGDSRKHVISSILFSSLVFGIMHITNILAGQGVVETVMQILQATSLGVFLGSIYYRTKNIWAVAFLHGFYDFSILLGDINAIKECTTGVVSQDIFIYQLISSILIMAFYISASIVIMNKVDTHKIIDEKSELSEQEIKKDKKIKNIAVTCMVILIVILFYPFDYELEGEDAYKVCYSYQEKHIEGYETHFSHYGIYYIDYEIHNDLSTENDVDKSLIDEENKYYEYKIYYDWEKYKLAIENQNNKEVAYIDNENVHDFIVIYNEDNYIIMYYDNSEDKIYYSKIDAKELANEDQFLEEINNSFKSYDVPEIEYLGYLTTNDYEGSYPYMVSKLGNEFIIDEDGNLFLIN